MSERKITTGSMPAADPGTENPFPPLVTNQDLHIAQSVAPAVPDEIRQNMTYGHVPNILPYAMQDGYDRKRKPRDFRAAVLECKSAFGIRMREKFPGTGGRTWPMTIHCRRLIS